MKKWNQILTVAIVLTTAVSPLASTVSTSPLFVKQASAADSVIADQGDAAAWAQEGIRTVKRLGIMNGDPNGKFRPLDQLTRQEFAVLLTNMLHLQPEASTTSSFNDVATDSWALASIEKLNQLGYMQGTGDGTFRPQAPISRQEVAAILVRALGVDVTGLGANLTVSDKDQISDWAKDAVQFLYQYDVMKGDGQTFAPHRNAQRQEIAVILSKAIPLFGATETKTISAVTDGQLVVDGAAYTVEESFKGLFAQANADVLKGAKIQFDSENQQLTKITYLEITSTGQPAASGQPEFSSNLVLDGADAQVTGNVKVTGDYITVKNLQVTGDFEIGQELENDFYGNNVQILGKTIINGGDDNTVVFDHSSLGATEINKPNVRVEQKNNTTVGNMVLTANATIVADAGVTIPKLTLADGVEQAEVNGAVTSLEVKGQKGTALSGAATIGELTLSGGNLTLNTTGEIAKVAVTNPNASFSVGSGTKVSELVLPDGKQASDVISNYDAVKGQIGKPTPAPTPAPSPSPSPAPKNHKPAAKHLHDVKLNADDPAGLSYAASDLATDADGDTLQFVAGSVSVSGNGVVTAEIQAGRLVIKPLAKGHGVVKLRVTDGSLQTEVNIPVEVYTQHAPVATPHEPVKITAGTAGISLAPEELASDADQDPLLFVPGSVSVSANGVVDAKVQLNKLVISPLNAGQVSVTARVTDGEQEVEVSLLVSVVLAEVLTAEVTGGGIFRVNEAGTEAMVHVDQTDETGNDVTDVDLSGLVIKNGTTELVQDTDYYVDEESDDILIDLSYLNGLTDGHQHLTLTKGSLSTQVTLEVLPTDPAVLAAVQAVNAATTVADTRAALEAEDLLLQLIPYSFLGSAQRDQVAQAVLDAKGTGYTTRAQIQDEVDLAVKEIQLGGDIESAVQAVNDATTVEEMLAALAAPQLHLDHEDFSSLEDYEREIVANYLIEHKGDTGYANRDAIQATFVEIITMILDDWYDIIDDVLALELGYATDDWKNSVTQDITLPTSGAMHGATITWTSDNPAIISHDGHVTRPDDVDTPVILRAHLTNRYEKYDVAIKVIVLKNKNGLQAEVISGGSFLEQTAGSETVFHVQKFVKDVPEADLDLSALVVRDSNGVLVKDTDYTVDEEADEVWLNLSYLNSLSAGLYWIDLINGEDRTSASVSVGMMDPSLAAAIQAVNDATDAAGTREAVEAEDLGLDLIPYSFLSSAQRNQVGQAVLDGKASGYVNRPAIQDAVDVAVKEIQQGGDITTALQAVNDATTNEEMLAALASPLLYLDHEDYSALEGYERDIVANYLIENRGAGYATRDEIQAAFVAIIDMIIEDWYAIVADAQELEIGFTDGDTYSSVTNDIVLPAVGPVEGADIEWTSDTPDVITNDGQVTRPEADTIVSLRAYLTNRYEHLNVTFRVLVKAADATEPAPVAPSVWTSVNPELVQVSQTDSDSLDVVAGTNVSDLLAAVQAFSGAGTVKIYLDNTLQEEAAADAPLTGDMVIIATPADGSEAVTGKVNVVDAIQPSQPEPQPEPESPAAPEQVGRESIVQRFTK